MKGNSASKGWPSRRVLLITVLLLFIMSIWLAITATNLSHQLADIQDQLDKVQRQKLAEKTLDPKLLVQKAPVTSFVASAYTPSPPTDANANANRTIFIPPSVAQLPTMEEIGKKTGTDKISTHRYHRYYPRFVEELRYKPNVKMLEIGFLLGQSFQMWKEYFPTGQVYFLDINQGKTFPESRFVGDSGNVDDLARLLDTKNLRGQLDLIVVDGSHYPPHQLTAFASLFEHGLKPGGVYIIEDIETSYWRSGECYGYSMQYGVQHPDALVTRMAALVDVVNRKYSLPEQPYKSTFGPSVDAHIAGVFFGTNTVVVLKANVEDARRDAVGLYRLKENLKRPEDRSVPLEKPKNAPPGLSLRSSN